MADRLPGLDLLRGIAALSVAWFHYTSQAHRSDPAMLVFEIGERGVEMFFTISGFVILMTAQRAANRREFIIARWIRLYPTFVFCMLLTTAWVLIWNIAAFMISRRDWLLNLTMLPKIFGAEYVEPAYWTLSYEIAFYSVVAILMPLVRRGYALHFCAAFLALIPALPADAEVATFFTAGIALYELNERKSRRHTVYAIAILIAAIVVGNHVDETLVAPMLVAIALRLPCPARAAAFVGGVSYPLYLLHSHIGTTLTFIGGETLPALITATILITMLAAGVYYYFDQPVRRFLVLRLLKQKREDHMPIPSVTAACVAPPSLPAA
jgi:peptidoglycan/LPS O-acetylase OafA/YrhL